MNWSNQSQQTSFYLQMMEKRIAKDDILRIIDEKINLSFVNALCSPYYSTLGPQGYCPERLFRMLIVMYLADIRSERQLVKELNENLRYMWFTKIDLNSPVPDHSTFSVLRERLGEPLFKQIFEQILTQMLKAGIIKPKSISVDSTSVLADVQAPSQYDPDVEVQDQQKISPHDPDARYGHTSRKKGFFGYKAQLMVDNDSGTILNIDAQPGSFEDKQLDKDFIKEPLQTQKIKPSHAALDKGFDSHAIRKVFRDEQIQAVIPLKKSAHQNVFALEEFSIDLAHHQAVCPQGRPMIYRGWHTDGYSHRFQGVGCCDCPLQPQCTTAPLRYLTVHEDYSLRQEAKVFNRTSEFREIYKRRNCVERVIGEAKRFHGMRRAKFRCRWKLRIQLFLTAIAINLKRIAKFFTQQYSYGFT